MVRIDVTVAGLASLPFAKTVDATGRFLVDQFGDPWFGVGEAAWSLVGQLTTAEISSYLEDRAGKGINWVLFNAPESTYADNAPNNANDDAPFTGTAFQSSLNDDYWLVVDHAVNEALRLGITCLICPAYLGSVAGDGWADTLASASTQDMADYGEALADRYDSYPNIMWLIGHDQVPDDTEKDLEEALAAQLPSSHLVMLGATLNTNILGSLPWDPTSITADVETIYSYSETPAEDAATAWAASPTRPFIWLEGIYENEQGTDPGDVIFREQMYAPTMAGATGVFFGDSPIWHFGSEGGDWEAALDSLGSQHLAIFADFISQFDWSSLAPDTGDTFLVSGEDTGEARAAARFSDQLGLVYMPTSRAITVDLTEIDADSARVRLFDPTDGTFTIVDTYETTGTQAISAPGTNSAGDSDWVVVVEAV